MASTGGPTHRSVASIRPQASPNAATPSSPHTPLRTISSTYGSPSALRAEEDCIVLELGSRNLKAGFAGDATPRALLNFGPEEQRRPGDYRRWNLDYESQWRKRIQGKSWGEAYELWKPDLRDIDLGLVGDKLERAIREAFTKHLLIDSRPRRIALVLPSAFPLPLLSTTLDSIFTQFQPPNISLMLAPVLSTIAAGLRSALIVDIGWSETVVTSIYEFREVQSWRSIRGGKFYGEEMLRLLAAAISPSIFENNSAEEDLSDQIRHILSFEECEEVITRMAWCKPAKITESKVSARELTPVAEEDELRSSTRALNFSDGAQEDPIMSIHLTSTSPPRTIQLPFSKLAEPCETALFASDRSPQDFDDEELPLHLLVYRSLLELPVDVRTMCMPRIVFVGGGANLVGLKERVLDEVAGLIEQFGWDPVRGRAIEQLRSNPKIQQSRRKLASDGPTEVSNRTDLPQTPKIKAAFVEQEPDPIEEQLRRESKKGAKPDELGYLRAVDSLGAWSGGSLISQLKVPAVSIIDRDQWLQHGVAGASREIEASVNVNLKRQSMGPTAFKSAAGDRLSWTLGLWG